ncbi:MAG TPA: cupin domain-containing protein [Gemmatimonadaceae bacterium]
MSTRYPRDFAPRELAPELEPTPPQDAEIAPIVHAGPPPEADDRMERVLTPDQLRWDLDTIDPRRSSASLIGDPMRPGPYTVRYRAPANYVIGLHMHPDDDEQLTVISGTIRWSTGKPGSGEPEYTLGPGGFAFAPAGTPHRVIALDDCVLQMSGVGPRSYVYLDEADDPRRMPPA